MPATIKPRGDRAPLSEFEAAMLLESIIGVLCVATCASIPFAAFAYLLLGSKLQQRPHENISARAQQPSPTRPAGRPLQTEQEVARTERPKMDERLKALLDYTTFHIGIYVTLGGAIIAADFFGNTSGYWLQIALLFLLAAGAAGGAVACNIPESAANATVETFLAERPKLYGYELPMSQRVWIRIEHGSFWVSILTLIVGYFAGAFSGGDAGG